MPIKVYINNGGGLGEVELTRYVDSGSIEITKSLNLPTTCNMKLNGYDSNFVLPVPRSYVRIYSTLYKKTLFTGLLTSDPSRDFVGVSSHTYQTDFQFYQYNLSYTSDEYLLSMKSVNFIPAYVNQTQGQILKNLAETLAPGYYDTRGIASGDLIPYLQYDPTKTWADYAKQFCDASRFRYACQDRQIRFQPYGDGPLGIRYDEDEGEARFDPKGLSSTALTTQIINDITVVGQQEAGNNHEDFFIGDGFTGAFPLKHQVYGLASSFQGSSVLLADPWTGNSLNSQNWFVQDPAAQFNYAGGALNIISGFNFQYGLAIIYANNAIELAGGTIIQHGDVQINDSSLGLLGGIYDDTTMNPNTCEAAFQVIPTQTVSVTISGASGVAIQPYRLGRVPNEAFTVVSKVNKTYTLFTKIQAPTPVRYYQVFRSIAGYQYGGPSAIPTVSGSITWTCLETDVATGFQTYYYCTIPNAVLPDTAIYGLINNNRLNISLTNTQIWTPTPGSLNIQTEIGAGALAPIYISGNVQFTGAFTVPSGGHLPISDPTYILNGDPVSKVGFGPEQQFDLGSGIGNQAAEIDSSSVTSTLNFYKNDLPGVGTRIRLQTWESQAAVSRVRNTASVLYESAIVGDDGVRSSVINNMNPLPRTSEDCDSAAQAVLADRTGIFYQGTYNCTYLFFSNLTSDIEFYPTCGRYLYVNSPQRNMSKLNLLVTGVTITVTEMMGEILHYAISFGPDLYLQKLLSALTQTPTNVLLPTDAVVALTPQQLQRVGLYYLPDVTQSTLTNNPPAGQIGGSVAYLSLQDTLPANAVYEIRNSDIGMWGQADETLIQRVPANQTCTLQRGQYDQSWYVRMVSGAYIPVGATGMIFNPNNVTSSRRTKVIRIQYPRIPAAPVLLTKDTAFVQMDLAGDLRNVEGLEIRWADNTTICYQCVVGSRFDLGLHMDQLKNQLLPGESGLDGLGQYMINPLPPDARDFNAYLFNLMWEYSQVCSVHVPPFLAPTIFEGVRWGAALGIGIIEDPADLNRSDLVSTTLQVCSSNAFASGSSSTFIQSQYTGNPGFATVNVPVTGDLYARAAFSDYVSPGAWSNTLYIPQGNLIASDYFSSQGSVPPTITNAIGQIITAVTTSASTTSTIALTSQSFNILYPNGARDSVAASSANYTKPVDSTDNLHPSTNYGFYPIVRGPTTSSVHIDFNGPYVQYATNIDLLQSMHQDGVVPLMESVLVIATPAALGTGGGGGGGSLGGGSCGEIKRMISMYDGSTKPLGELKVGDLVKGEKGTAQRVNKTMTLKAPVFTLFGEHGYETKGSLTHTLKHKGTWYAMEDLISLFDEGESVTLHIETSEVKMTGYEFYGNGWIVKLELDSSCDHTYILDGFVTHNIAIKS